MELLGSRSYMRALPFEQALRDVRAGITHPLAPEKTLEEVGKEVLGFFAGQPASGPSMTAPARGRGAMKSYLLCTRAPQR